MLYRHTIDLFYRLQDLANALIRSESPMFDVHSLEVWDGAILEYLASTSAPLPPSELAAVLVRYRATITKATDRLLKAGYISKIQNERDGRSILVSITPKGRLALELFTQAYASLEKRMLEGISKDRLDSCLETLSHMEANLK